MDRLVMDYNVDMLARTIWGEARNQRIEGRIAVANVIMNRVKVSGHHAHFGTGSIASACRAPWQFSCWNPNDVNFPKLVSVNDSDFIFKNCIDIAQQAQAGLLVDITGGATHYYADYSPVPRWAKDKTPCAVIGRHLFFRDIA